MAIERPDLRIDSIEISNGNLEVGKYTTFKVKVKNHGDETSSKYKVLLYSDFIAEEDDYDNEGNLGPGDVDYASVSYKPRRSGYHNFVFIIAEFDGSYYTNIVDVVEKSFQVAGPKPTSGDVDLVAVMYTQAELERELGDIELHRAFTTKVMGLITGGLEAEVEQFTKGAIKSLDGTFEKEEDKIEGILEVMKYTSCNGIVGYQPIRYYGGGSRQGWIPNGTPFVTDYYSG